MPAYIIVEMDITDPDGYVAYGREAAPTVLSRGGRFLAASSEVQPLEGGWHPKRLVVVEFPDAATAREWWSSDDYAEPKRMRLRATTSSMVLVDGLAPPP